MGSWNSTCAVSNLPIAEKQRAVMIPLMMFPMERMAGGGMCESTSVAQPVCLPIRGVYDTYGGIGVDEGSFAETAYLSWIAAKIKNREVLHNGTALTKPMDSFDFYRALEQGELSLRGSKEPYALGFMLVLESVFDAVVKAAGDEEMSGYQNNDDQYVSEALPRRDYFKALLRPSESGLARVNAMKAAEKEAGKTSAEHILRHVESFMVYSSASDYINRVAPGMGDYLLDATRDERVFTAFNEFFLFQYAFNVMRKTWLVPNGKTQTELGETRHLYKAVAETMLSAIIAEEAELEE
jgi:hypothetical protein